MTSVTCKTLVATLMAVAPLEGYEPHEWVVFERALVVRDLFTGGTRTFHSTKDAQDFRAALYQQYGEQTLNRPSCTSAHASNTSAALRGHSSTVSGFATLPGCQANPSSLRMSCVTCCTLWSAPEPVQELC